MKKTEKYPTVDNEGHEVLADDSKSNSIDVETLSAKVFMLANELAIAGYGNAAVKLHTVHNGMITKGHYYSC
tara:strand:+ start:2785 stop:3000 length:216 start_codon:yes stop_codon:yes gene_type:complete